MHLCMHGSVHGSVQSMVHSPWSRFYTNPYYTSAKIIQLNEWGCRNGMHNAKNHGNNVIHLALLSRILAQSCVTPLP